MLISRRDLIAGSSAFLALPAHAQEPAFTVLEARKARVALDPASKEETEVWCFNGEVPGPVLRVRQGQDVRVRFVNKLDEAFAIHWGGVRIRNAMDGVPDLTQKPVGPGESFNYVFTAPDAGTYWYHASGPNMAEQVARGLCGVLIVEESEPPAVHHEYLAVLTDWKLDGQQQIASCNIGGKRSFHTNAELMGPGRIGGLLRINAKPAPEQFTAEPGTRVRLRIANLSTARIFSATFEGVNARVVGIDGQACGAFEPLRRTIPVGPGARFDVILDAPAQEGARAAVRMTGTDQTGGGPDRDLIVFDLRGKTVAPAGPITNPPLNPALPAIIRLDKATRLDINIEGGFANAQEAARPVVCAPAGGSIWKLNGKSGKALSERPLFSVARGSSVSLGFINKTRVTQVVRVHGHVLRQLHLLDDGWEPYWRDSLIVPAGKTVRAAFVADNPGKWRLGSGILEHAVSGFAAWFEVKD